MAAACEQRGIPQCDACGKEYSYEPGEVLRLELEFPKSFKSHRSLK